MGQKEVMKKYLHITYNCFRDSNRLDLDLDDRILNIHEENCKVIMANCFINSVDKNRTYMMALCTNQLNRKRCSMLKSSYILSICSNILQRTPVVLPLFNLSVLLKRTSQCRIESCSPFRWNAKNICITENTNSLIRTISLWKQKFKYSFSENENYFL